VVRCKLDESFDCGPVFDFSRTAELIKLGEGAAATALEGSLLTVTVRHCRRPRRRRSSSSR
jgi:hypothetical protein